MHVTFLLQDTGVMYGAERATLDLVSGLRETGQVEVSATLIHESRLRTHGSGVQETFAASGIPTVSLPTRHSFSWSLVKAIRRHVLEQDVDCLHVVGYKAAVHGGLAVRFGRICPWVSTVHGWLENPDFKERLYGSIEVQALKRAQCVVVLSEFYRDKLLSMGIPHARLIWIPSGLKLESLEVDASSRPFMVADRPPTVGILGRLSPEKNHALFLRVARQLLQDRIDVRFLIAGDGPERNRIEALRREWGLEDHVAIPGVMERGDFFRRIDLLTLCSRIENLPYVILEAMAWSRPVVATRVGGVPDLVVPEKTGLLVDDQDADGMADAIRRLLADRCLACSMGAAGRKRVMSHFTLRRSCETHVEMYRAHVSRWTGTPSTGRA